MVPRAARRNTCAARKERCAVNQHIRCVIIVLRMRPAHTVTFQLHVHVESLSACRHVHQRVRIPPELVQPHPGCRPSSGIGGPMRSYLKAPTCAQKHDYRMTPSVGSTPEVVAVTPGLIITTAPGTEKIQTRSRGAPSTRGHAGSVSLHAHIPGDIASFTTQHGAEGAVLTTTSQCEFRSLVYL